MITRQPVRVVASTFGESHRSPVEPGGTYRYRFDRYARAREDGKSIPAAARAVGISLETAAQYEPDLPAASGPEPVAIPALGPTEQAILAELVPSDGLIGTEIGQRLGRTARSVQRSIRGLEGKGCVTVLTYRRGHGTPAAVWGATTTGRAAFAAHQQGATS